MRLLEVENELADYLLKTNVKRLVKEQAIEDAADNNVLIDYSPLESDQEEDIDELTDIKDFFKEKVINL